MDFLDIYQHYIYIYYIISLIIPIILLVNISHLFYANIIYVYIPSNQHFHNPAHLCSRLPEPVCLARRNL
jgi:hypothetical protein